MKYGLLAALLMLASCQTQDKLATSKGPYFSLNSTHWMPSASEVRSLDEGKM